MECCYWNIFEKLKLVLSGAVWVLRLWNRCDESIFWLAGLSLSGGWLTGIIQLVLMYIYVDFRKRDHQSVITKHDWEKR